MTARSEPPTLEGLTFVRWLGGGGFADVFLYRQRRPDREVAVKALRLRTSDGDVRRAFDAEADLMARVSDHPYIVSIFAAEIAADGRPCLVMEYYPNGHFGELSRPAGLSVERTLRTGIQVASSVETAHRAGILHRDIKPANVLISRLRKPGLTDFGIAGLAGDAYEAAGLSIPYAAPEVVANEGRGSVRSDVYSMAATVYALLAGRSPFEVAGHDAGQGMISRILNAEPAPLGRPGVPHSLEYLLRQGLSRRPEDRPGSALSFARGLQDIERELRLDPTPIEVQEDAVVHERRADDSEGTRAAPLRVVAPLPAVEAAPEDRTRLRAGVSPLAVDGGPTRTRLRLSTGPGPQEAVTDTGAGGTERSRRAVTTAAVTAALVIVGALAAVILGGHGSPAATTTSTTRSASQTTTAPPLLVSPSPPSAVTVTVAGSTAAVSWTPDGPEPGDLYRVLRVDPGQQTPFVQTTATHASVGGLAPGARPCFEVAVVRAQQLSDPSAPACAT